MIDFPASPTVGQVFTSGTQSWTWDGTKWAATGTVTATPLGSNRLINGNFAINQRGYVTGTALTAAAYAHDRWKAGVAGCNYTFVQAIPDTQITITAGTLTQVIEGGAVEGGTYSLSWSGSAQGRVYQGAPTGAYNTSPFVTGTMTAGTNVIVEFNIGTLTWVKLETGSKSTLFTRQAMAELQLSCERYFRWLPYNIQFVAVNAGDAAAHSIPYSMRAAPTIGTVVTDPNAGGGSGANAATNAFDRITQYGARAYITATAAGSSFRVGYRASADAEL